LEMGVREGTVLDFKRDFPRDLAKTLSAFANTHGGVVLIGVDETTTGSAQLPMSGVELKPGLRERILQIALDAVYPPIIPEVKVVEFKSNETLTEPDRAVVVARVHESHAAPHAVETGTAVYLRIDNISDHFSRKATIGELEWLMNKRHRALEEKQCLLRRAEGRADIIRPGRRRRHRNQLYSPEGAMRLHTTPAFPRANLTDGPTLVSIVRQCRKTIRNYGWPLPDGQPRRVTGGAICDGHESYSEFQQQGLIYHEIDYWWDYLDQGHQRTNRQINTLATAAVVFASLDLSRNIYREVGYPGLVEFSFGVDGLQDSFLIPGGSGPTFEPLSMIDNGIRIERQFTVKDLEDRLKEIVKDIQREIYWAFGYDATDALLNYDCRSLAAS
jgi:hypothetical protein